MDEIYEDNRTDSSNYECDDENEQDTHSEEDYQASEGEEKDSNEENDETPNKDEVQLLPDLSCQFCGKLFTTKGSKNTMRTMCTRKTPGRVLTAATGVLTVYLDVTKSSPTRHP